MVVCAGHGMIIDNMQGLILNEYDEPQKFHKVFRIEAAAREIANKYHNSYVIGLFTCTR